jgi:hypothetical protein
MAMENPPAGSLDKAGFGGKAMAHEMGLIHVKVVYLRNAIFACIEDEN